MVTRAAVWLITEFRSPFAAARSHLTLRDTAVSCLKGPIGFKQAFRGSNPEWKYKISQAVTQYTFDTNFDSRPDLIKTYRNNDLIKVEPDRNCDGRIDLVEEYQHGKLVRMVGDDNFDGKPETINTYRDGKLAIVEHDPDECGSVDRADYYADSGKLIRSGIRKPGSLSQSK